MIKTITESNAGADTDTDGSASVDTPECETVLALCRLSDRRAESSWRKGRGKRVLVLIDANRPAAEFIGRT